MSRLLLLGLAATAAATTLPAPLSTAGCGESAVAPLPGPAAPVTRPGPAEVWGYGLLMVTLISLTSLLGVGVLPLMSRAFYANLLTSLIGLAVGSLAGSAVFHLIPSAFRLADSTLFPHHSYLNISLAIWLGLYSFFIIERFLKIVMDAKARRAGELLEHCHTHCPPPGPATPEEGGAEREMLGEPGCGPALVPGDRSAIYNTSQPAIRASFGHQDRPHPAGRPTVEKVRSLNGGSGGSSKIATVAWMIIFGDGIHNFIDGLSIGAAFSESTLTGLSVSLAVLCEEFPHELGDFAVLLNSGMSVRQAMSYNFLSACTCYLGLVLGILLGELEGTAPYIFALAGGMFLYISLVDMVPELNETVETASRESASKAMVTFGLQNIGILVGIFSLYFLARYQDDIQIGL